MVLSEQQVVSTIRNYREQIAESEKRISLYAQIGSQVLVSRSEFSIQVCKDRIQSCIKSLNSDGRIKIISI